MTRGSRGSRGEDGAARRAVEARQRRRARLPTSVHGPCQVARDRQRRAPRWLRKRLGVCATLGPIRHRAGIGSVSCAFPTAPTLPATPPASRYDQNETDSGAGSPRAVTRPGFPQIRTCPSTRHPAPHLMTSLRCSPSRGLPGRGEDCIAPPDERIRTTAFVCLGGAETATVARSRVQPPGIPGGSRSCQ
jgi:hypothetical protein